MKEINVLEGKVVAKKGMKAAIVAARFNEIIVNKLLGGAVDGLVRHGVEEENITAAWVPGAFEIPLVAERLAKSGKYDAVICVGAVIRGDTTHYDYVCNEVSKGIAQVGLVTVSRKLHLSQKIYHFDCRKCTVISLISAFTSGS